MALILTVIETRKGVICQESLGALAVGRKVASARGATLYAVLMHPSSERMQQEQVVQLAAAGADRVILVTQAAGPPENATWAAALMEVLDRFHPTFLLLGATRLALELAPCLCLHIKGVYAPNSGIFTTPQLKIDWFHPERHSITEFFEEDLEIPLVAIVNQNPAVHAGTAAEIEVIPLRATAPRTLVSSSLLATVDGHAGSDGVMVVMGSLALHRSQELSAWCAREEWPLIRLADADGSAIPWWQAEPAGESLLLVGCTAEEFHFCQAAFPLSSRWVCIGCQISQASSCPRGNIKTVAGELDAILDALFQKEA